MNIVRCEAEVAAAPADQGVPAVPAAVREDQAEEECLPAIPADRAGREEVQADREAQADPAADREVQAVQTPSKFT